MWGVEVRRVWVEATGPSCLRGLGQNDALSNMLYLQRLRCDAEAWKVWETTDTQQQAPPPEGEVLQCAGAEHDRHPTADPTYKTGFVLTCGAYKKWVKEGRG